MPQVPVLDQPAVQETALQPVYQRNIDVSSGLQQGAQALNQGADVIFHAEMQKARADAWNIDSQLKQDFGKFQADLQTKMPLGKASGGEIDPSTGQPSAGYADQVRGWFDQKRDELLQSLAPAQRALVSRSLAMYSAARIDEAYRWQKDQTGKYEFNAWSASKATDIDNAIKGGPDAVPAAVASIKDKNAQWAASHGMTSPDGTPNADFINEANRKDLNVLHAGVVTQLMQQDPTKAASYLEANKDSIEGTTYQRLNNEVQTAAAGYSGEQKAEGVWQTYMGNADPSGPATAVPFDKMQADVHAAFAGNPTAEKAAMNYLHTKWQAFQSTQKTSQDAYAGKVMDAIAGGATMGQIMRMPEYANLDGQTKERIQTHVETLANQRLARSAAADARADREEARADRMKGLSAMDQYAALANDPGRLANLSADEVKQLPLTFSQQQVAHLVQLKSQLNSQADVKRVQTTNEQFDALAPQFGLPSSKEPNFKNDSARPLYFTVKARVDQALQQAQHDAKRPLSQDEQQKVIQKQIANTIQVERPTWMGLSSETVTVPAIAVSPEDAQHVTVPAADRQMILDAYKARGLPAPDDNTIRAKYLQNKTRGVVGGGQQ